MYPDDDSENDI